MPMKAVYLIKYGPADNAFEIREVIKPVPKPNQVLIKVEAFGLNFADVMARLRLYKAAPPLPAILGYDVVGKVEAVGKGDTLRNRAKAHRPDLFWRLFGICGGRKGSGVSCA